MIPKFRAYAKRLDRMMEVTVVDFEEQKVELLVARDGSLTSAIGVPFDDIELMQSTGLFDKNGVEIFEGDVVQYVDASYINGTFEDTFVNTGVVEFSQGMFTISNREAVEIDDLLDGSTWDVEVIGNIYENPELVEVTE